MGQSGTATSGRGLTGMQIVSAIRMQAMLHEKCNHECSVENNSVESKTNSFTHAQSPRTGVAERFPQLHKEAYTERSVHRFLIDGKEVEVSEYAPKVFCLIRKMNYVNNTKYIEEWTLPDGHYKMNLSAGRSQAFFINSRNMLFLSKTIAKEESKVLSGILESYTHYLSTHPDSFLSRFYMLLSIKVGKRVGYILCTSDVFSNVSSLYEKWDIKGRMPKLGKFFYIPHLVPHTYDPNQTHVNNSRIEKGTKDIYKITQNKTKCKEEVITRHDKDLTRMFWIKKACRDQLIRQVLSDYAYLASVKLMDYSLLIGVSCNNCDYSSSIQRDGSSNDSAQCQPNWGSADLSQVTPCVLDSSDPSKGCRVPHTVSKYEKGIPSVLDEEVYYIGIIDVLTRYSTKKKLAKFFKSFLWAQRTLSTIPPKLYRRRIDKYTQIIFPKVC
ncbi:unnamed protein product [Phytomonas sp. Hart1]|nr:unnamed protein product [Phytomonas sp. Hart1]|eukprot:CCW67102.1 unnamed protein product [Phytomonas sp. isolate Hart1]